MVGEWRDLEQINIYIYMYMCIYIFEGLIHKISVTDPIFSVLNNNFSYTQLSFFFILQKGSYYVHNDADDTDVVFFFRKILISAWSLFFPFFSLSSSERFWYLSRASFRNFSLCFWQYLFTIFMYKNNIKNIF